jgi:hypothetical protein
MLRDCPLSYEASKKNPRFAPQILQNFKGYKEWRLIFTTREFYMRSSINFVVEKTILDLAKGKETRDLFKGRASYLCSK